MTNQLPSAFTHQMFEIHQTIKLLDDESLLKSYLGLIWIELFLKGMLTSKGIQFDLNHDLKIHLSKLPCHPRPAIQNSTEINTAFDYVENSLGLLPLFEKSPKKTCLASYPNLRYVRVPYGPQTKNQFYDLNLHIFSIEKPLQKMWSLIK
jgi:hypothetical protein